MAAPQTRTRKLRLTLCRLLGGSIYIFMLVFHLCQFPTSHSCKFPSKVADFVWNPQMIDGAGYFLPLAGSSPDSASANVLFPGSLSTSNCVPRFSASGTSPLTIYTADCGNHFFIFKCSPIGGKAWILDCKHDTSIVPPPKQPSPSPLLPSSSSSPPVAGASPAPESPSVPSANVSVSFPPLPATLSTSAPPTLPTPTPPGLPGVVSVGASSNGTFEASFVPTTAKTIDTGTSTTVSPLPEAPDPTEAPMEEGATAAGLDEIKGTSPPPANRVPIWCFWCWPTEKRLRVQVPQEDVQDFSHTVITSFTDHKTYGFMNRCFYKLGGQFDWIVFSTTMDLPAGTKTDIISHANSLGYSTATASVTR